MTGLRLLLALTCLAFGSAAGAQTPEITPMLVIFDSSGSMTRPAGAESRIVAAKRVMTEFLSALPDGMPLGLTIYGHRRPRDCRDIENVRPISPIDRSGLIEMSGRIGALQARGETPIAQTLIDAIPLFGGRRGRILLVTDGREECGGDVCAAAQRLAAAGISLRVDIIGFGTGAAERTALRCITDITGGRYLEARDAASLASALRTASQPAAPSPQPQPTQRIATGLRVAVFADGRVPDGAPIVRVRGDGNLERDAASPAPSFDLPPGRYRVTAQLGSGRESAPAEVEVQTGRVTELRIDLGTGRLVALLTSAGRPFPGSPNVELRRGDDVVTVTNGSEAIFDAEAGIYTLRVLAGGNDRHVDVPNMRIAAGATNRQSVDVPVGVITVTFSGASRPGTPMIHVLAGSDIVHAEVNNPARFVVLPGAYDVVVFDPGTTDELYRGSVTVVGGETQNVQATR
jgi:Ca-activated chloride channel family protein